MSVSELPPSARPGTDAEHEMIPPNSARFCPNEIAPVAASTTRRANSHMTSQKDGQLGLMGIEVPEELGAPAWIPSLMCWRWKKSPRWMPRMDPSVGEQLAGVLWAIRFGTEAQKQKVPGARCLGAEIGAYSLTEPMSGSERATCARGGSRGRQLRHQRRKSWVTSAPVANLILVVHDEPAPEKKHRASTAFLIDTDRAGFSRGKTEPKLASGPRPPARSPSTISLPGGEPAGREGEAFKIAMAVLDAGRIGIAAQGLALPRQHTKPASLRPRAEAFGTRSASFTGIQFKIADMKPHEAARLLTYNAALAKDAARRRRALHFKGLDGQAVRLRDGHVLRAFGGSNPRRLGYSKELPIERYFRDRQITEIYEGTSEIQRMVIGGRSWDLR